MANSYWQDRIAKSQERISKKSIKEINRQLQEYYGKAAEKVISDFEAVYLKILETEKDGRQPTAADLYALDKYWEAHAQMKAELEKLGNREIKLLSRAFRENFFEIYYAIALPGEATFNTIDAALVDQLINSVWVADGKTWSQRVWTNTEQLAETLNEELVHIVVTGKKSTELKKILQERFGVSYHRAETLVRTEVTHIQSEAAKKRYKDYGVEYVEVLINDDDRTCEICKALKGKKFPIRGTPPIPAHPNERCCLLPVIE